MKKYLLPLFAVIAIMNALPVSSAETATRDMLVILTSADRETQAMALILSNQTAGSGIPVNLMLCGSAGDIALKEVPEDARKAITPKGMTVVDLLNALKKKGAKVDVCKIFLPNRKLGADALAAGIGVANPKQIVSQMTAKNTRLVTF